MGYLAHHAIVVTDWDNQRITAAHIAATAHLNKYSDRCSELLLSPIIQSLTNHQQSFFIAPDGSKEGWITSDDMDKIRTEIVEYLSDLGIDFVCVRFGGDNKELATIERHS